MDLSDRFLGERSSPPEDRNVFFCIVCERELSLARRSRSTLITPSGEHVPICHQCDGFFCLGLASVHERIEARGYSLVRSNPEPVKKTIDKLDPTPELLRPPPKAKTLVIESVESPSFAPRPPSAVERESFAFRSLGIERYAEGFIKGLQATGLDRQRLGAESVVTINALLALVQQLAKERSKVTMGRYSRADVRRLTRQMEESRLLIEDHVTAIQRQLSRRLQNEVNSR